MRHDPADPHWVGRDRFVLSCGHSSLTLYIQLYLAGFGLELEDLAGAADVGVADPRAPGVSPHQGRGDDHRAAGSGPGVRGRDGDGVPPGTRPVRPGRRAGRVAVRPLHLRGRPRTATSRRASPREASSIAGRQELGNLIVFYDHNEISIEDDTNIALSEDVAARYEAYGWHVQKVEGGENVAGILEAIEAAKAVTDKPSFIQLRTIIGYPAPTKMNTGKAHGSALGAEEIAAVKTILGFDPDASFEVDDVVIKHTRLALDRGDRPRRRSGRRASTPGRRRIRSTRRCSTG